MLSDKILSHPQKKLIDHIIGVMSHVEDDGLLSKFAPQFHDLGKIIREFQKKIRGVFVEGYSNHSYISAYFIINGFLNSLSEIQKKYPELNQSKEYKVFLVSLINVLVGHHGWLRNIGELFFDDEWNKMIAYLKNDNIVEKINQFYSENRDIIGFDITFADDIENESFYKTYQYESYYSENALANHFNILMAYAELVNGDRRDASGNNVYYRNEKREEYNFSLSNNLNWLFDKFNSGAEISELNLMRNEIRKDATNNLLEKLRNDEDRVFTLTAPTGAGKTLLLLSLATTIMKERGVSNYDIMYCIPFLSIADQTTKIINDDLRLETLNFTSSSDTSNTLQKFIEKNDDNKELLNYSFSENILDHPLVITTFNQLFETFLSNKTSKAVKLKYLKNRIFLIDEYQTMQAGQYYLMVRLLQYFCEKYDSYTIVSSATMPNFDINLDDIKNDSLKKLLRINKKPLELLSHKFFNKNCFNRYDIKFIGEYDIDRLTEDLLKETDSTLCIVNTRRSSRRLISNVLNVKHSYDEVYLLNAKIVSYDRSILINNIKRDLKEGKKILVISTQVVEAGVDFSFKNVYRDLAPPPNIVQAGGRCNRSWEFDRGLLKVFLLLNDNDRYDCVSIYTNRITKKLKDEVIKGELMISEPEFHKMSNKYFYGLSNYLEQGITENGFDIVNSILEGRFADLGKYKVIEGNPESYILYVGDDDLWSNYVLSVEKLKTVSGYQERELLNINLKKIKSKIIQHTITINNDEFEELDITEGVMGIYKLLDKEKYSSKFGLL